VRSTTPADDVQSAGMIDNDSLPERAVAAIEGKLAVG
jgi:hypothetical protein